MTPRPFDVAIVGLGPTGAVLANLLGARGVRTVVFEQSAEPFPQPRACHLDAEIARVLQQVGLADELGELLTVSGPMSYVDRPGRDARVLFRYEEQSRPPVLGWHEDYVFVQPELDTAVRRALARYGCVDVRLGTPAPSIAELLDIASYVVAADGASSPIRSALGIELVDHDYDEEWLVVDVFLHDAAAVDLPHEIQQVCDPARQASFVPSHGTHRRFEFKVVPGEDPDPWDLVAPWGLVPSNAEMVRSRVYRFHALVAESWRGGPHGRVFLAGDAAHQMPPFLGQGMCAGARDAANLAWKLAQVVETPCDEDLLDTYETERRPHVEGVIAMSVAAGRLISHITDAVAAGRAPEVPPRVQPEPGRWSRLSVIGGAGPFPIGHPVPQPTVGSGRFDDLLGDGWAVVLAETATGERLPNFACPVPPGARVVVEPRATYGHRAVLVRPDRIIADAV